MKSLLVVNSLSSWRNHQTDSRMQGHFFIHPSADDNLASLDADQIDHRRCKRLGQVGALRCDGVAAGV